MQLSKCPQCNFVTLPGVAACKRCGAALADGANTAFTPPTPALTGFVAPAPTAVWSQPPDPQPAAAPPGYEARAEPNAPQFDHNYYAARASARQYSDSERLDEATRQRQARHYSQTARPRHKHSGDNHSVTNIFGEFLFKLVIYPAIALLFFGCVWHFVVPRALASSENPNLPVAAKPWFNSWLRGNPTAEEILQKHRQASGELALAAPPKSVYMKGAVEMTLPPNRHATA